MPSIVNLSSIHTYKIEKSQEAFVTLCDRYSRWAWFSDCCPTFFSHYSNKAWVAAKYALHLQSTIVPYKLGRITTEEFLKRMCDVFPFLVHDTQDYSKVVSNLSFQSQGQITAITENETEKTKIAKALLEQAWTAGIDFTEEDKVKLQHLLEIAKTEPIYLISNTNPLDINKIIYLFRKHFPKINWSFEKSDMTPASNSEANPLQIAPNIYLCVSHHYGLFKTTRENENHAATGTPSLLKALVTDLQSSGTSSYPIETIKVISQHKKDLDAAREINIPEENIFLAENYYQQLSQSTIKLLNY